MYITLSLVLLGMVLAPFVIMLTKKTVQQIEIKNLLNEVTRELTLRPHMVASPIVGVAREVLSPNPCTDIQEDNWHSFTGGSPSLIVKIKNGSLSKNMPFEAASVTFKKDDSDKEFTFLIYTENGDFFIKFKDVTVDKTETRLGFISKAAGESLLNHLAGILRGQYRIMLRQINRRKKLEVASI